MEANLTLWMVVGFLAAAYSVIGNDAIQTLGTFIASNHRLRWQYLWLGASSVLAITILYGWYTYGGDISYGRLNRFEEDLKIQWYHAMAPVVLLILTRFGIPVSTSFLVLSAFATGPVFEEMAEKSLAGYAIAVISALVIWGSIIKIGARLIKGEKKWVKALTHEKHDRKWRVFQWLSTGFLWFTWLSHDTANIAVFLPRKLSFEELMAVIAVFIIGLWIIFQNKGGKIQQIVREKSNTEYVRSATIIDLVYAFLLLFFKELNDIPMSTTWVFVGLLHGREFIIQRLIAKKKERKTLKIIVGKDLGKMGIGIAISLALAFGVQWMAANGF